jgi:hypothetical protein
MKGYVTNIEQDSLSNKDFRRVLYTAKNTQLVLMMRWTMRNISTGKTTE